MRIIPLAYPKMVAITLRADFTVFAFFGASSLFIIHCFDWSFVSGVQWCIHVSSTVTNQSRNSFKLMRMCVKRAPEATTQLRLFSAESKYGTHLADIFLISNLSCKIETTVTFDTSVTQLFRTILPRCGFY